MKPYPTVPPIFHTSCPNAYGNLPTDAPVIFGPVVIPGETLAIDLTGAREPTATSETERYITDNRPLPSS